MLSTAIRRKPCGDVLRRHGAADRARHLVEPAPRRLAIERLVAAEPEHRGEMRRVDPPEHQVAVGDRQRPALAVAGRARDRPRRSPGRPAAASRRTGRPSRRPPRRCGSASSARAGGRRRRCSRRPVRTRRHSARRRSRCRPCRTRSAAPVRRANAPRWPRPCRPRPPAGPERTHPCRGKQRLRPARRWTA